MQVLGIESLVHSPRLCNDSPCDHGHVYLINFGLILHVSLYLKVKHVCEKEKSVSLLMLLLTKPH